MARKSKKEAEGVPVVVEDEFPWGRLDEVISEEVDEVLEAALAVDEWLSEATPSLEVMGCRVNCPFCGGVFEVEGLE